MLILLPLFGCPEKGQDPDTDPPADTATDTDTGRDTAADTDTATDTDTDTTIAAIEFYEGTAALTTSTWTGSESLVATTADGTQEFCRLTNETVGERIDLPCVGCDFVFDVVMQPGTLSGDHCDNMKMYADQNDGEEWIYAFAPLYVYHSYEYNDVVLWGEIGDTGGVTWRPFATGEVSDRQDGLIYRTDSYPAYYYAF